MCCDQLHPLLRAGMMSLQGFPAANTHVLSDVSDQLAIKALTSSTQDRDEEDKKNLLSRSKCQSGVPEDQSLCPCKDGNKPCYWSSCATTHENSNEWISFRLNSMVPHRCNTLQHHFASVAWQAEGRCPAAAATHLKSAAVQGARRQREI